MGLFDRLSFFHPKSDVIVEQGRFSRLDHRTRILHQKQYWDAYNGKHWRYPKQENIPQVTINYCRAFINKQVAFLFREGFKFVFEDPEEERAVEPYLEKIWDQDNDRQTVCYEMSQVGGVTGDAFVLVTVVDREEDGTMLKASDRKIRLVVWNPTNVIPEWEGDDKSQMIRVTYFDQRWSHEQNKEVIYALEITKDEYIEKIDDEEISRTKNILGLIPVVHIPNMLDASAPFGISDLEDVWPLNKEYNEKSTDVSDVLDYLGQPVVVVKGANANKIKGTGRIWAGLPVNSSVDILNLNAPMEASVSYLQMLKKGMHEVSGVPEASLGEMQPISNTSGVALHTQYLPLMERVWMKRITYGKGIKKITELALRYMEIKNMIPKKVLDGMKTKYDTTLAWNDPLPKDQLNQLNIVAKKMELGLASRKSAMRELGIEKAESILDEIDDDRQSDIELVYGADGSIGASGGGAGPSGFEPGNGEHRSD